MKVDTAEITAPSIIPIIGTISDERSLIFLKKTKKIIVPTKEKMIAPVILWTNVGAGINRYTRTSPNPAHSIVPVVVDSTKRFCVMSCMTRPAIDMAAPVSINAAVLGTRVIKNICIPSDCPYMSYTPVNNEMPPKITTTNSANRKDFVKTVRFVITLCSFILLFKSFCRFFKQL